jgi:hypothetical protein
MFDIEGMLIRGKTLLTRERYVEIPTETTAEFRGHHI